VAVTGERCLRKNHLTQIFEAEPVTFNQHSLGFTVAGSWKKLGEEFYRTFREFA
jgi:hypothetical protein